MVGISEYSKDRNIVILTPSVLYLYESRGNNEINSVLIKTLKEHRILQVMFQSSSSRSRYICTKAKSNRKRNEVLIIQQQIPHLNLFSSAPTRAGNGLGTFYHQLCMELQGKRILLKNKQDFKGSPRDFEKIPQRKYTLLF